jgi:6-phosphofructokinase
MKGNLLVLQGGGPTAVINSSLKGVIEKASEYPGIEGIYGVKFGIEGLFSEDFIDLKKVPGTVISGLAYTPSAALGSCRRKVLEKDYPVILEKLEKHNIRFFFNIGGNDTMDTCNKVYLSANKSGYDLRVIGIPKTIDNDLEHTDHCPGFGSAARYVAVSAMELAYDVKSLPIHVCIMETMGRNAGWLTAAASLARTSPDTGPHLIYLPERPFDKEVFLEDIRIIRKDVKGVLVVVSEGLTNKDGSPVADAGFVDGFGHKVPGGVAQVLSTMIMNELGIKSRSEKPGLLGRCSIALQSPVDRLEAENIGRYAVQCAVDGNTGYMVSIKRISNNPYKSELYLVPLEKVANAEKKFPAEWINERGSGISRDFYEYCLPLLGEPLPQYVSI